VAGLENISKQRLSLARSVMRFSPDSGPAGSAAEHAHRIDSVTIVGLGGARRIDAQPGAIGSGDNVTPYQSQRRSRSRSAARNAWHRAVHGLVDIRSSSSRSSHAIRAAAVAANNSSSPPPTSCTRRAPQQ
jgi:hypothetical protein